MVTIVKSEVCSPSEIHISRSRTLLLTQSSLVSLLKRTLFHTTKSSEAKMPFKVTVPEWLKNPENLAKGYSYVYLILGIYQVLTFWYDVAGFWGTWRYVLIFVAFVVPPVVLGFILLIAVHKRELQKTWIWWLLEILILALYLTLFLVGIHGLSWKTVLVNLILHGGVRILGLKIIYDYMICISATAENGSGINRIDVSKTDMEEVRSPATTNTNPFENVPLDDPWSGQEKL